MSSKDVVSFIATPDMMPLAQSVRRIILGASKASFPAKDDCAIREVIPIEFERFADGVSLPQIQSSIRRTEVYVFYSPPRGRPDLGFAELTKILDATYGGSPVSIKLVLPNFWEGRADRKPKPRVSMNAQKLAILIDEYAEGLFTFDLHAEQILLAFRKSRVDNLKGQPLLAEYCVTALGWKPEEVGIVAADGSSVKRAEMFAEVSGFPVKGFVYKERKEANAAKAKRYIGEPLNGLHVLMSDDIIDTAGTLVSSGQIVLEAGAKSVTACTTHWEASPKAPASGDPGLLTAENKLRHAGIKVIALNTIPRPEDYLHENADFLTMIPCDHMLAGAIMASLTPGASVSELSEKKKK